MIPKKEHNNTTTLAREDDETDEITEKESKRMIIRSLKTQRSKYMSYKILHMTWMRISPADRIKENAN